MTIPVPGGIPEADGLAAPASVRPLILAQQQDIQALEMESDELRSQLIALASELAGLLERIGRRSPSSPTLPSSTGFQPPERLKGSGCKRCGQPGHPESAPELLPVERVEEVVVHHPDACRRCGPLEGPGPSFLALLGDVDQVPAAGVRAPSASSDLPLLFLQHLRHAAGGWGSQSVQPWAQCLGGPAWPCLPVEYQQDSGAAGSAAGGGVLLRSRLRPQP